jgi:hypothetical protein
MKQGPIDTGRTVDFAHDLVKEASEKLFYGVPDGDGGGHSPFAAVAIVGVYHVLDHRSGRRGLQAIGALLANNDFPDARGELLRKLREMVGDLEDVERSSKQVPT